MTSVMNGMQDIILGHLLCHEKCKLVHLMVKVAHVTKQHLRGYEEIPVLEGDDGALLKPFCFRIGVKDDVPLYTLHGIAHVSISVPCDAMGNRFIDGVSVHNLPSTIEIALCNGAGELSYKHPLVSNVKRFSDVASLLLFLDKLANDSTTECGDDEDDYHF